MKQVLQSLRDGSVEVADVPAPGARRGELRIATRCTLISSGTERMMIEFGRGTWFQKAAQQPDKVRMVLAKVRTDGLAATWDAVRSKLDQPLPLGYCNVGRVLECGDGVQGFAADDRVVSNGKHAEVVGVPANLCVAIPACVPDEHAAFTVVAAIGLQGIRLVQPTLGEVVVVTGLGLIGLLTVQMLRAHGCRVLGLDFDPAKLAMAQRFGAEVVDLSTGADPVFAAERMTRGRGVDAVIITAATRSNEPVHQAALMCRKRGRIVLVGVTGLELSRADFYEKELTFQVSCSYGPGRYDPAYEEKGCDYPIGFVRWTEQRNFEAVLDMLADGRLDVAPLISHEFEVDAAARAYDVVAGAEPSLGILLKFAAGESPRSLAGTVQVSASHAAGRGSVSVIGAGSYASAVLMPAFKSANARLRCIASAGGATALHLARKFGFESASTDVQALVADKDTDAVVIATRHDTHATLVELALRAGKHVFVEKPLALTREQVDRIEAVSEGRVLMVGFNRRFSPLVLKAKRLLEAVPGPKAMLMTVNAGAIPAAHWTQDPVVGGGRLLGEGCHFIDLLRHLAGAPIVSHHVARMDSESRDSATVVVHFADGSIGTLHYLANGNQAVAKERLEVFASGRILQIDNFLRLQAFGWPRSQGMRLWRQDKGQRECVRRFVQAITEGRPSPIPHDELFEVSRVSIDVQRALSG